MLILCHRCCLLSLRSKPNPVKLPSSMLTDIYIELACKPYGIPALHVMSSSGPSGNRFETARQKSSIPRELWIHSNFFDWHLAPPALSTRLSRIFCMSDSGSNPKNLRWEIPNCKMNFIQGLYNFSPSPYLIVPPVLMPKPEHVPRWGVQHTGHSRWLWRCLMKALVSVLNEEIACAFTFTRTSHCHIGRFWQTNYASNMSG